MSRRVEIVAPLAVASALLVVLLAAAPGLSQAPDDRLIVPGQRIGKWSLGATVADLIRVAGPPRVHEAPDANRQPLTVFTWAPPGIAAVSKDKSKIDFFYLYGGDYRTDRDIGRGSTREAVRRAYRGIEVRDLGPLRAWVYDRLGVAFVISAQRVSAVLIFPPGTSDALRVPTVMPAPAPPDEGRP